MICCVSKKRHHEGDDCTTDRTKQDRKDDQSRRRRDGEPAKEQQRRNITGSGYDIELSNVICKEPAQDASKKGAGIDECKQIASEIGRHAMSQAIVCKIKVRRPET